MSRVSKTMKGMEKKLTEELKDRWSENRFEEFKTLRKTAKATNKTSSSNPDGPPDSPRRTTTPPPPPPPLPPPLPKPPCARPEDENQKGSKKGKEKELGSRARPLHYATSPSPELPRPYSQSEIRRWKWLLLRSA